MKYYDENRNGYYNPDDGQDGRLPGENANWKAIQAGFAASAAKDSQQDTDVASAANVAEAARRTADQALEAAQAAGGDITDLEAAVQSAAATAGSALTAAQAAQQAAGSAGTAAGNAMSAAQAAQSTADGAAAAAQSAGTAAAAAQSAAGNASSAASSAAAAAQAAQQTADGAATAAQTAQTAATAAGTAAAAAQTAADNAANGVSALLPRVAALEQDVAYMETPYDVRLVKLTITATYPVTIPANGFAIWSLVSTGSLIIPGTGPDDPDHSLEDFARYAVTKANRQFTFTAAGAATNDLVAVYLRSIQTDGARYSLTVTVNDSDITNGVIEVGIFNNSSANVTLPAGSGIVADVFIRRAGEVYT